MAQLKRAGAGVPKKDYVKLVDGFLAGTHSKVGDIVRLTDAQAKYPLLYGWVKECEALGVERESLTASRLLTRLERSNALRNVRLSNRRRRVREPQIVVTGRG